MNTLDSRLLEILVCPICKGPLKHDKPSTDPLERSRQAMPADVESELRCPADRLAFPVRDGIVRMLVDEARVLPLAE